MKIFRNKFNAEANTPDTDQKWRQISNQERKELVSQQLKKTEVYKEFVIVDAAKDGQVILRIEKVISAKSRGQMLLECEEELKKNIDDGITIWLEPVGDKSKLRNLRGVKIKI